MSFCVFLAALFTFVELNCENLFDTCHDAGKRDQEFLPTSVHRWNGHRYWRKLDRIGQSLLSAGLPCGGAGRLPSRATMPDMMVLTEVENDTVMRDLTRRSALRAAGYEYVMTDSPDQRGIDVALLWSPFSFRLISHRSIRVPPLRRFRPTRDILYASGEVITGDTLHVLAVHAPSRSGGERATRPYRMLVARQVCGVLDSIFARSPHARVIVAGDFNDYAGDRPMLLIQQHGVVDVSAHARGCNGAKGTYRWHGAWGSLDHILCDAATAKTLQECRVADAPFLLEADEKYGGVKPYRTYLGPRYLGGFSDHLPLVAVFGMGPPAPVGEEAAY